MLQIFSSGFLFAFESCARVLATKVLKIRSRKCQFSLKRLGAGGGFSAALHGPPCSAGSRLDQAAHGRGHRVDDGQQLVEVSGFDTTGAVIREENH